MYGRVVHPHRTRDSDLRKPNFANFIEIIYKHCPTNCLDDSDALCVLRLCEATIPPDPEKRTPLPDPVSNQPAVLALLGVRHRYRAGEPYVLWIEDLSVAPGEQVVLTGSSGSGKSTLLHLAAGLMEPSEGTVSVAGTALRQLRSAKRDRFRGRQIGMVFQTFQLLHGFSARENILAAMMFSDLARGAHDKRADELLGALGIERPNAMVGSLSIGQQQRVAVARAIACSPALVLADEPTASLDPEHAQAALDLLQGACRSCGAALVCVTHDLTIVDRFDRRIELSTAKAQSMGADHVDA